MRFSIKNPLTAIALPLGILAALPLCFDSVSYLAFLLQIPLAYLLICSAKEDKVTLKKRYLQGLLYFLGYFCLCFSWFISMYPLEFTGLSKGGAVVVVLAGCVGLSLLQALLSALAFVIFELSARTQIIKNHPILLPVIYSALFTILFYIQTLTWAGTPWGMPYLSQHKNLLLIQTASLFGSHFLNFIISAVNAFAAYALYSFRRSFDKKRAITSLAVAAAIFVSNFAVSTVLYLIPEDENAKKVTVTAIQANISSNEKWSTSAFGSYCQHRELTESAEKSDIILWPETAITDTLKKDGTYYRGISSMAKRLDTTIIVGAFYGDSYTSLFAFYPDGSVDESIYSKRHLVPFGEFVPMKQTLEFLIPPLSKLTMYSANLKKGDGTELFNTPYGKAGGLICFDSIFPALARESTADGAEILLVATNDSWFSDSIGVYQHKAQSVFRSVENGKYTLRSAATGISCVIDSNGRVLAESEPLTTATVTAEAKMLTQRTLYSYIGDTFVYLCIAFVILPLCFEIYSKIKHKNSETQKA